MNIKAIKFNYRRQMIDVLCARRISFVNCLYKLQRGHFQKTSNSSLLIHHHNFSLSSGQ